MIGTAALSIGRHFVASGRMEHEPALNKQDGLNYLLCDELVMKHNLQYEVAQSYLHAVNVMEYTIDDAITHALL